MYLSDFLRLSGTVFGLFSPWRSSYSVASCNLALEKKDQFNKLFISL